VVLASPPGHMAFTWDCNREVSFAPYAPVYDFLMLLPERASGG
jgi:hypothetical protein